jgi:hypothetical protein
VDAYVFLNPSSETEFHAKEKNQLGMCRTTRTPYPKYRRSAEQNCESGYRVAQNCLLIGFLVI